MLRYFKSLCSELRALWTCPTLLCDTNKRSCLNKKLLLCLDPNIKHFWKGDRKAKGRTRSIRHATFHIRTMETRTGFLVWTWSSDLSAFDGDNVAITSGSALTPLSFRYFVPPLHSKHIFRTRGFVVVAFSTPKLTPGGFLTFYGHLPIVLKVDLAVQGRLKHLYWGWCDTIESSRTAT